MYISSFGPLTDLENILLSHFIPPPSIKFLLLSHERSSLDATSVFHWAGVMTNTLSQLIKNTHRTDGGECWIYYC